MVLDYRNTNTLCASILVETLHRLGLQTAIICPGSRSAPLAIAFAQHPAIDALSILDERSAAFFALGRAQQSRLPVALICTSGTAGANFFPAVIEASESHIPLLILTADRPPELRQCHAGQAINQTHLFGQFPNWYTELAMPSATLEMLAYLRQTTQHAWERSRWPEPGPVHLNIPFRDPLAPTPEVNSSPLAVLDEDQFFQAIHPTPVRLHSTLPASLNSLPLQTWQDRQGVIIAGPSIPKDSQTYCQAIAQLSQYLGWPVLADGLSPLRNFAHLNPYLIATYDIALRVPKLALELAPEIILQLGELPTSKPLRQWINAVASQHWILEPSADNVNPLHHHSIHVRCSIEALIETFAQESTDSTHPTTSIHLPLTPYLKSWLSIETHLQTAIHNLMLNTTDLRESKVAWMLSQCLPQGTPLLISNSMPVRDVEMFWQQGQLQIQPYFNRGANGIDGTLSTALGMAHRQKSSVLLTGDLALLHDTNGFLAQTHWQGHLTIVLINNNGGGIFGMLPIAQFDPPFETFFATPQHVNFASLCQAYGVVHEVISTWKVLKERLSVLPSTGIRVLEIQCDRTLDAQWRQNVLHLLGIYKVPY